MALVFIEGRFVMGITGWERLGVEIAQAIIWSCLAMSILFADVINNWMEIRSAVAAPIKSKLPMTPNVPEPAVEVT